MSPALRRSGRPPVASAPKVDDSAELTPLSDRLGLLLVVRLSMAVIVMFSSLVLPALAANTNAILVARIYVAIVIGAELFHRLLTRTTGRRWLLLVSFLLLIDGLFIAAVLAGTGQSRSIFLFLAYAHIVSVTLLVGFRTGLKMAFWHSILLLTVYYLVLAGWIPETVNTLGGTIRLDAGKGGSPVGNATEVASAIALWLVAIVTAVFSSINERELRRRKGELTIIADLSSAIERTRRPSEILQALIDVTVDRLACHRAVAVCAHAGSVAVIGGSNGVPTMRGDSLAVIGGSVAMAAASGSPVLLRRLDVDVDRFLLAALPDAQNVSVIPLVAEGEAIAVLVAEWGSSSRRRVTRPMIELLNNVAGRVALSLSNTFLLAEVQRLASVDGLTGLPNRRTFNEALSREVARAERSGNALALVMIDIDHFKSVNDNHGHQMGDQVLAESAGGVLAACRGEDLPARYGGEEMAVIMPGCTPEQALAAADRIRAALGAANVTLPGVSASAGVACFPGNANDLTSLLAAADEALYASKANGRDRTTLSTRKLEPAPASETRATAEALAASEAASATATR